MKKLALLLVVSVGIAALAYSGQLSAQYTVGATNNAPVLPTEGLPLLTSTSPAKPVQSLAVTVADYNDGGDDGEFIRGLDLTAYVYRATLRYGDGGAGWERFPEADLILDAGFTVPARGITRVLTLPTNSLAGDRIYYQTSGVKGFDGGTPVHTVNITGAY